MRTPTVIAIAFAAALAACGEKSAAPPPHAAASASTRAPTGEGRLAVPGGRIWYRVTGTGHGTPVILVHGGPGYSSYYLKPFEELGGDRPVVRYDQLGAGRSDHVNDTTLFTLPHFVAELDSLRAHLGYPRVHLVGHSWGTMLAFEYYRAHPEHVASLTLESASLDIPAWERNTRRQIATLSDSAQRAIRVHEADHHFDAPDYQAANEEFFARYVVRHPVQADMDSTMATMNPVLYGYMQGPSEFTITGTLRGYDATPRLGSVRVPTLYTVGEFDEADPATIRRFARMTPGAAVVVFPGAAHLTPWDARDANVGAVRDFLRRVDGAAPGP